MRLFVLSRHAESTLNHQNRVNGDPSVAAPLTDHGREQARLLGVQVRNLPLDCCVHTRFGRTLETATLALEGRAVELAEEPLLDDVKIGELEGETIDDYRAWKREHTRADRFPAGESLDEAAARYCRGFEALLAGPFGCVLVVCHEIPIRYAVNAAAGSDDLDAPVHDIPNATPVLFDEPALALAAQRIGDLGLPGECGREDSNLQGLSPNGT
jgi:broad specificity phosphatase PhoE